MSQTQTPEPERQLLLCALGVEWYGFDLSQVTGVINTGDVTPVPGAPAHILGVQNVQGRLLAILDTAGYLGLASSGTSRHVVVLRQAGVDLGCLVDGVVDIVAVGRDRLQEPLAAIQGRRRVVSAQVRLGERLVGLLDMEALITEVTGG